MVRPALALFAATAIALPATAQAAEVHIQATNPVVELTINEIVETEPDVAEVGAGVMTQALTAEEAVRQNAQAMRRIVQQLKALGIDDKDIQTSSFNLNPQFNYDRQDGKQTFNGYQVNNQVRVTLRDLDKAGPTLDALVKAGANNLYGPNFMLEDNAEAKRQARRQAFQRGMAQARELAGLAGYTNVRLLEVSESYQSFRGAPPPVAMRANAVADESTPIEPGQVGTGVTLGLKYEMVN